MTQQRTDFVVHYLAKDRERVRPFWNEKDARAFAKTVDATRIDRSSIETIWECDDPQPESDTPQPESTRYRAYDT